MNMENTRNILISLLLLSILSSLSLAVVQYTATIIGGGTIYVSPPPPPTYELTIYERGTTTVCSSIDWGTLQRGDISTHNITVANTGTGDFTSLNMTYTLSPSTVGTFAWDIEGVALSVGSSINSTLTLSVASNAPQGSFTLDIYINGET